MYSIKIFCIQLKFPAQEGLSELSDVPREGGKAKTSLAQHGGSGLDQFHIYFSNVFFQRICIEINDHTCLQGLTGERRYTKSPPKTRSSIFSSKPYNASHYVPSFSSKVHKFAAPDVSLSKKCQKCTKRCNCHSHKQLPCHRKSRYLGVPLWPRNCNTKTSAPLPRFLI